MEKKREEIKDKNERGRGGKEKRGHGGEVRKKKHTPTGYKKK